MSEQQHERQEQRSPWCDRHWAPYRENRASGLVATVLLMQAALRQDAPFARQGAALVALRPICCHLGEAELDRIFQAASQ